MPTIRLTLDEKSIAEAIKALTAYRDKIEDMPQELIFRMTEQGVSFAQQNASYMDIYDSGELVNNIDSKYENEKGYVYSGAKHSAFCEFGTGVVGLGSQHPNPPDGWTYDSNEHGEDGWWYYNKDGERRWTKGMPSRPYMYDTSRMLRRMTVPTAKEVLK